jgi:hypothetical protein
MSSMLDLLIALRVDEGDLVRCSEVHAYDDELDDITSVLHDACEILSESKHVRFVVHGFSEEAWRVDVWLHLSVLLEQLPTAIARLRAAEPCTIDFYEQGTERRLDLSGAGDIVEVTCVSRHARWQPVGGPVMLGRAELVKMLLAVADDFYGLIHTACEELANHPWMLAWKGSMAVSPT